MAFIAVDEQAPGNPQTLGVARLARQADNEDAEFAVLVRSDQQRRGLGRLLMQALMAHAAARGTQRLVGHVLRDNAPMLQLLTTLGFSRAADADQTAATADVVRMQWAVTDSAARH